MVNGLMLTGYYFRKKIYCSDDLNMTDTKHSPRVYLFFFFLSIVSLMLFMLLEVMFP